MADRNGYIGRAPGDSAVTVARQTFSPTGVTTDFTFASGYTVGYLDLFLNGTKLIEGVDYTATDTSTISLISAAINGDVLEGVAYKAFNLGDVNRIGIQSAGTLVGNVNTLNFVGAGNSILLNGGTIDVSISGGSGGSAGAGGTWSNYDGVTGVTTTKKVKIQNDLEVTGVSTFAAVNATTGSFSGNVSVGGTLTYEDVTNVDSVGLVTARTGVNIVGGGLTVTGVSTFHSNVDVNAHVEFKASGGNSSLYLYDENSINLGSNSDARLIYNNTGNIVKFDRSGSAGEIEIDAAPVTLQHSDSTKLQTTGYGVSVTGAVAGYDYLQAPFGTTVNFAVTVASKTAAHRYPAGGSSSGNGYVIDGVESPFLTLTPGRTYRFTLSSGDMTSHPFRFYLEADKTTAYTTNVTSTSTYTEIVVTDSTPQVLHYQCSAHGYMGNAVNTNSNVAATQGGGGITTEAATPNNAVTTLDLTSAQDHKITASGITTITVSGGTEAESHTVRIINSGITTVGFSTYFLFPSGSTPSLPTASGAISLISFTVNRVGTAGTQLLAGASVNYN